MTDRARVLVVGGDGEPADLAEELDARAEDLAVQATAGPDGALDWLGAGEGDCVVAVGDGERARSVLSAVRDAHPGLPVVLYVEAPGEPVRAEAADDPATDYVRRGGEGDPVGELAYRVRDAVERRRTEARLRRREAALEAQNDRLEALFENFPEPTVAYVHRDGEPHVVRVNEAFTAVFGYAPEEAVGEHIDDLVVPPARRGQARDIDERVRAGEAVDEELERETTDGLRTFRFRNVRLPDDDDIDGYAVYADVTDRVRRERELERQIRRLDEFARVVSHDLRNPLKVAEGRLSLARDDCDSPHLDDVEGALDRMEALIEDLLTFAREGNPVEDVEAVALADLAETCWGHVAPEAATLEVEVGDDWTVRADRSRLQRLLENLLRNAVEHGSTSPRQAEDAVDHGAGDDGAVTVTVGLLADGRGFYVADDGPGIPEGERERVLESGYSTAPEGTGLGLSIVQGIASAHDWTVAVTESEDGGARFEFRGVTRAR